MGKIKRATRKGWSNEEKAKLMEIYEDTDMNELEKIFKRNARTIRSAAKRYGITKTKRFWSKVEIAYLLNRWEKDSSEQIAEELNQRRLKSSQGTPIKKFTVNAVNSKFQELRRKEIKKEL